MNKNLKLSQAYGQLLAAVMAGGVDSLWRMAGRPGAAGELARTALEYLTAPNSEMSAIEAVNLVILKIKD